MILIHHIRQCKHYCNKRKYQQAGIDFIHIIHNQTTPHKFWSFISDMPFYKFCISLTAYAIDHSVINRWYSILFYTTIKWIPKRISFLRMMWCIPLPGRQKAFTRSFYLYQKADIVRFMCLFVYARLRIIPLSKPLWEISQYFRNFNLLRAVAYTAVAGRTRNCTDRQHPVDDSLQYCQFLFGEFFIFRKCRKVLFQLFFIGHAGEDQPFFTGLCFSHPRHKADPELS